VGTEESTRGVVIEFLAIVGLKTGDWTLKLHRHIGMKFDKVRMNIRLVTQKECPGKMRIIIQNYYKVVLITRYASYRGSRGITMN
jgi:hypothetical protein